MVLKYKVCSDITNWSTDYLSYDEALEKISLDHWSIHTRQFESAHLSNESLNDELKGFSKIRHWFSRYNGKIIIMKFIEKDGAIGNIKIVAKESDTGPLYELLKKISFQNWAKAFKQCSAAVIQKSQSVQNHICVQMASPVIRKPIIKRQNYKIGDRLEYTEEQPGDIVDLYFCNHSKDANELLNSLIESTVNHVFWDKHELYSISQKIIDLRNLLKQIDPSNKNVQRKLRDIVRDFRDVLKNDCISEFNIRFNSSGLLEALDHARLVIKSNKIV